MTQQEINVINTNVKIGEMLLSNPVIAASGTFGFGQEFSGYIDLSMLGAIAVKGITLKPRKGNRPPRIAETPAGILNSVGLQNPGVEAFLNHELPFLRKFNTKIIVNAAGDSLEDYLQLVEILSDSDIDAIELNLSCPNVKKGCSAFGSNSTGVSGITYEVRKYCKKPLIVKLTPNVTDITEIAIAAEDSGADAISLINTILGMAVDLKTKRPVLANNYGGLSGPAVKPIALRMVHQVYSCVKIPVIGMGGIMSGEDALEFIISGATAIMAGTANFINPRACVNINNEIIEYLKTNNIKSISEITGALKLN